MPTICRKCYIKFPGISELRKHQWSKHREMFNKLVDAAKKSSTAKKRGIAIKAAYKARKDRKELAQLNDTQPQGLSAVELLNKLKVQQTFINDVVSLIGGLIEHHAGKVK